MKYMWNTIQNKNISIGKKNVLFLLLTTLIASAIGFIIWFALHFFVLNKISWAICFIGYPGYFIGLMGGVFYLFRHEFKNHLST